MKSADIHKLADDEELAAADILDMRAIYPRDTTNYTHLDLVKRIVNAALLRMSAAQAEAMEGK